MGAVTIFAILSWYFVPEQNWLKKEQILKGLGDFEGGQQART
jgi:translation initiation factor 5B